MNFKQAVDEIKCRYREWYYHLHLLDFDHPKLVFKRISALSKPIPHALAIVPFFHSYRQQDHKINLRTPKRPWGIAIS